MRQSIRVELLQPRHDKDNCRVYLDWNTFSIIIFIFAESSRFVLIGNALLAREDYHNFTRKFPRKNTFITKIDTQTLKIYTAISQADKTVSPLKRILLRINLDGNVNEKETNLKYKALKSEYKQT